MEPHTPAQNALSDAYEETAGSSANAPRKIESERCEYGNPDGAASYSDDAKCDSGLLRLLFAAARMGLR